jgi:hypothetical protein
MSQDAQPPASETHEPASGQWRWRCSCGESGDDAEGYDRGCNTHACPMRAEPYVYVADRPKEVKPSLYSDLIRIAQGDMAVAQRRLDHFSAFAHQQQQQVPREPRLGDADAQAVIAQAVASVCSDANSDATAVARDVLAALRSAGYVVFKGHPTT